MTLFFQNHDITIYRQRRIGSTNRFSVSATLTSYQADIQPASLERAAMIDGRYGAAFVAYVDVDVDIKENDQIRTEDGKKYGVRGVEKWDNAGLLDHKMLSLVSLDG